MSVNPAAMTERLIDAAIYAETASGVYVAPARREVNDARAEIEAEISRLREALTSETEAREKAERLAHERGAALKRERDEHLTTVRQTDATIADLTRKLEAAAGALVEIKGLAMMARGEQWNRDSLKAILRRAREAHA